MAAPGWVRTAVDIAGLVGKSIAGAIRERRRRKRAESRPAKEYTLSELQKRLKREARIQYRGKP